MKERFKVLYFEHFDALLRFASFYAQDHDEASSAVQQVFLNVWEKRDHLLQNENPDLKSYLFTAVRNKVFTDQRRKKFESGLDDLKNETEDKINAQELLEVGELDELIKLTISQLPEKCRYIFKLSREEGMSYKEIAQHLEISPKTVENQISKALKILKLSIYGSDNQLDKKYI